MQIPKLSAKCMSHRFFKLAGTIQLPCLDCFLSQHFMPDLLASLFGCEIVRTLLELDHGLSHSFDRHTFHCPEDHLTSEFQKLRDLARKLIDAGLQLLVTVLKDWDLCSRRLSHFLHVSATSNLALHRFQYRECNLFVLL
jgi:hypothetical protein